MSKIITFYSYKGGVGRSLALVNVATLLSKWGNKVLMIDWDLEAPGLENFFRPYLTQVQWATQKGLLDLLLGLQNNENPRWQDWILSFSTEISKAPLNLLISGKSSGDYTDQLRGFNVSEFYQEFDGANHIETLRKALLQEYDFILIDSRTGVTDFGGICTIQMPDILIPLLTATEQGLNGTVMISKKVQTSHASLPFDRDKLLILPVPSRIDQSEYALTQVWLDKIAENLEFCFQDWLPFHTNLHNFIRLIKIPYIPYFSYGEKLPVIEQGVTDPAGLGYAYENLALLVARGLDDVDSFIEDRESYLSETIEINDSFDNKNELPKLIPLEEKLLKMLVLGKTIREISKELKLTTANVERIKRLAMRKLGANTLVHLGVIYEKEYASKKTEN